MSSELETILESLGFEPMTGGNWHRNEEYIVMETLGYGMTMHRIGTHYGIDNMLLYLNFLPDDTRKMNLTRETIKTTLGL